ncbi:hypothetical protein AB3S75_033119 [Citrus x aurantiifolia]
MGVPAGDEATELASFLGVLARTLVSILYSDWRKVPPETKERLWKSVLDRFIVHPRSRKFPNDKKKLYTPPIDYPQIKRPIWIKFIRII